MAQFQHLCHHLAVVGLAAVRPARGPCLVGAFAQVATAGELAIDYFVISTKQDQALSKEQEKNLQQHLKEIL
jgi:hypothetical protein